MAGQSKVAWDSVEVWQKLVAAIIATGVKVDVSAVATHFGTSYDTVENKLRPIKKQAKALQEAVNNGTLDKVTATRKSPSKPKTPKKNTGTLDSVNNGRIGKTTPVKKNARKNAVKLEAIENSFSSMVDEDFADVGSPNSGFDGLDFDSGINLFG